MGGTKRWVIYDQLWGKKRSQNLNNPIYISLVTPPVKLFATYDLTNLFKKVVNILFNINKINNGHIGQSCIFMACRLHI